MKEIIMAALDIPRKVMPVLFKTMISLSAAILPYVRNMDIRIAMGTESSRMEG